MHLHPHIAHDMHRDIERRRIAEAAASNGARRSRQVASTDETPAHSQTTTRRRWLPVPRRAAKA